MFWMMRYGESVINTADVTVLHCFMTTNFASYYNAIHAQSVK